MRHFDAHAPDDDDRCECVECMVDCPNAPTLRCTDCDRILCPACAKTHDCDEE